MLLKSWRIYENYTGPLGVGTLTDIIHVHFGPGIESSENNGWGRGTAPTTRASARTAPSPPAPASSANIRRAGRQAFRIARNLPGRAAAVHASRAVRPRAQLRQDGDPAHLRFALRRRPRRRRLGRQLGIAQGPHRRRALRGGARGSRLSGRPRPTLARRDCNWFLHKSGIADDEKRVGNYPNRFEAEAMELDGYEAQTSRPGKPPPAARPPCSLPRTARARSATNSTARPAGSTSTSPTSTRTTASRVQALVDDQLIDEWKADDTLPHDQPNGHTSTRHKTPKIVAPRRRRDPPRRHRRRRRASECDYLEIVPTGV